MATLNFPELGDLLDIKPLEVVQWLRPCVPNAGGLGPISGQGTGSHMLQLKISSTARRLKITCATTNTLCRQINIFFNIYFYLFALDLSCGT